MEALPSPALAGPAWTWQLDVCFSWYPNLILLNIHFPQLSQLTTSSSSERSLPLPSARHLSSDTTVCFLLTLSEAMNIWLSGEISGWSWGWCPESQLRNFWFPSRFRNSHPSVGDTPGTSSVEASEQKWHRGLSNYLSLPEIDLRNASCFR